MGPTCEVHLAVVDDHTLIAIYRLLTTVADRIDRTRKDRVWDIWIHGRPVHVHAIEPRRVATLSAGCITPDDYDVLRELSAAIVDTVGGVASEPEK